MAGFPNQSHCQQHQRKTDGAERGQVLVEEQGTPKLGENSGTREGVGHRLFAAHVAEQAKVEKIGNTRADDA
jgi:hypothetical protein